MLGPCTAAACPTSSHPLSAPYTFLVVSSRSRAPSRYHSTSSSSSHSSSPTALLGGVFVSPPALGDKNLQKSVKKSELPRDLHLVSKSNTTCESGFQYLARTAQDNGVQQPCPALPWRDRPTDCAASRRSCQLTFNLDPRVCSLLWGPGVPCSSFSRSRS